jgi:hypothetical protein
MWDNMSRMISQLLEWRAADVLATMCDARGLSSSTLQAGAVNGCTSPRVVAKRSGERMESPHPP